MSELRVGIYSPKTGRRVLMSVDDGVSVGVDVEELDRVFTCTKTRRHASGSEAVTVSQKNLLASMTSRYCRFETDFVY